MLGLGDMMFYIDAHCDSVIPAYGHLDFNRMRVTESGIQFMACFSPDFETVIQMLDKLDCCGIPDVLSRADVGVDGWRVLRSIEGGDCLNGDLSRLDYFYKRGVRAMGLTWNNENPLSGGADSPEKGLTPLGILAIKRMEELGIAVDLAHISEKGFWDALEVIKKPPIVSHTAANALYPHRRNLTDGQIRAVAARGGVIGICLYPVFLGCAALETVARHIAHIRNVGGEDCVGIGTDFDGIDSLPDGISGVEDMPKLFEMLDEKTIGLNFARVLREILD